MNGKETLQQSDWVCFVTLDNADTVITFLAYFCGRKYTHDQTL